MQLHLDFRIAPDERGNRRTDVGATEAQRRIYAQQPLWFCPATRHLALHFFDLAENPLGIDQVELALGCEADAACGAIE
ncbi:hypothetical protein D3C86_2042020 [compost metagenome]